MMQFVPEDGVYVYFRYDAKQTVMCIMNTNDQEEVATNRFVERMNGFKKGTDIASGVQFTSLQNIKIAAKQMLVLELQ
jgi:hypothetical protein